MEEIPKSAGTPINLDGLSFSEKAAKKEKMIGEATDFETLFRVLDQICPIVSPDRDGKSGQTYPLVYLKGVIQNVRDGIKPITDVTRTHGLRDKVRELLNK